MATIHIFDFLDGTSSDRIPSVCVVFGGEPFLRREGLRKIRAEVAEGSPDASYQALEGERAEWRDVMDEVSTVSLFGGGSRRLVVVEDADEFVTKHRAALETFVERPRGKGVLVLDVETWAANTRLYKAINSSGLQIDCRPPEKAVGNRKVPDEARTSKWLGEWCQRRHDAKLDSAACRALLELVGTRFGILDQELAKLALFAGPGGKITQDMVHDIVGGWRTKSIWDMTDAILGGNAAEALKQLDFMIRAGDYPIVIFAAMAGAMRRFGAATRAFQRAENSGRPISVRDALVQAGVPAWKGALDKAEEQLKQLGRHRAGKLYRWLLDTDLALKGSHSSPDRARFALERFIIRCSKLAAKIGNI
jgi:DNA polymerase-3 subunit delta